MPVTLPDPEAKARKLAAWLKTSPEHQPHRTVERVLIDAPNVDRASLLEGIEAFHAERLGRTPSPAKYPEAADWVDHVLTFQRTFREASGMSDQDIAIYFSFHDFSRFRGFARARLVTPERCRTAYFPESEIGQLHFKNLDDPITYWEKQSPPSELPHGGRLVRDGVGSGLHMDDEPEEIFPLPIHDMQPHYSDNVPGAVDFYTRYCPFFGGGNFILHDWQGNSAAIEKCSYNFIEVFEPGPDGRSWVSGMTCRDAESPQGKHQQKMRQRYADRFGLEEDCSDMRFWAACRKFEEKLSGALKAMGERPSFEEAARPFITPWPDGLNKAGLKLHPDQGLVGYTLKVDCVAYDQKTLYRWQRDPETTEFAEEAEVYRF